MTQNEFIFVDGHHKRMPEAMGSLKKCDDPEEELYGYDLELSIAKLMAESFKKWDEEKIGDTMKEDNRRINLSEEITGNSKFNEDKFFQEKVLPFLENYMKDSKNAEKVIASLILPDAEYKLPSITRVDFITKQGRTQYSTKECIIDIQDNSRTMKVFI